MKFSDPFIEGTLIKCYKRFLADIDPEYTETLCKAVAEGVEVLTYRANVSTTGIRLGQSLPVLIPPPGRLIIQAILIGQIFHNRKYKC